MILEKGESYCKSYGRYVIQFRNDIIPPIVEIYTNNQLVDEVLFGDLEIDDPTTEAGKG